MSRKFIGLAFIGATLLGGCSMFGGPAQTETDTDALKRANDPYHTSPIYNANVPAAQPYLQRTDESGDNGFSVLGMLFDTNKNGKSNNGGGGPGIGVNSYLWHGTLDTVSFLPITSADPFGGTIITDWYSPAQTPNERFKVNVFILAKELRADGVKVTVFRQKRDASGQWVDAAVDPKTGMDIENSILARARQLRLSTASTQ